MSIVATRLLARIRNRHTALPHPDRTATEPRPRPNRDRDRDRAATARERTNERKPHLDPPFSIVYLITFTCYGTHLHGDERGSVDRIHNLVGSPTIEPTHAKIQRAARTMEQAPYFLDEVRRGVVLESVCRTCAVRQWRVLALHVRSNHVHCVVRAEEKPERIMTAMKAHASRALDREGLDEPGRKRWTRHGSTRYLWDDGQIHRAIAYVVEEQGQPMAVFQETNSAIRSLAVAAR